LADHYLDTRERAALRGGYAVRLREDLSGRALASYGQEPGGAAGALHSREEVEPRVPAMALPEDWPDGPARESWRCAIAAAKFTPSCSASANCATNAGCWTRARARLGAWQRSVSLDEVTLTLPEGDQLTYELEIELGPDGTPADLDAWPAR
jgi:inorganic triphosphatase YgiF